MARKQVEILGARTAAILMLVIAGLAACSQTTSDSASDPETGPDAEAVADTGAPGETSPAGTTVATRQRLEAASAPLNPDTHFEVIATPDLLVGEDVRDIVQDRDGFMWFGMREQERGALVRYDGYEMVAHRGARDQQNALASSNIWMLEIDDDGVMWVGTVESGLHRYNADTEDFTRFFPDPNDPTSMPSNEVKAMIDTGDGRLWFGTVEGLVVFDKQTEAFTLIDATVEELPDPQIRGMTLDPTTGELWLGTRNGGLTIYNPATAVFRNYMNDPDDETSLSNDTVDVIMRDRDGVFWLATRDGLNRYNAETDDFTRFGHDPDDPNSLGSSEIWEIFQDSHGRMWVGHNVGLDLFDPETGTAMPFRHFTNPPGVDEPPPLGAMRKVYEDDFGALWFSSLRGGVNRLSPIRPNVQLHSFDPEDPSTLSNNQVVQLLPTEGGMWVTTQGGVDFFDGESFERMGPGSTGDLEWPAEIVNYLPDQDRNVWMSGKNRDLVFFDRAAETFTHYPAVEQTAGTAGAYLYKILPNGDVWFNVGGFGPVKLSNGEYTTINDGDPNFDQTELALTYVSFMEPDPTADVMWIGGLGLGRVDLSTDEVSLYLYDPERPRDPENSVNGMVVDGTTLWLSTLAGLRQFHTESLTYGETFDEGLSAGGLSGLAMDDNGSLWGVSGNRLAVFDPATEEFRTFAPHDSLGNLTLRAPLAVGDDGRIYVAVEGAGVLVVDPETMIANPVPPRVELTGVDLFGIPALPGAPGSILPVAAPQLNDLNLANDQNHVSFTFTTVDYEDPQRNQFEYRLQGFEDEWIAATPSRRVATYTNLPAGDYTFEVRAANNNGVWSTDWLRVPVRVSVLWWANPLAYGVYAAAFILLVGLFIRWRLASANARNELLETQLEERRRTQVEKDDLIAALEEQADRVQGLLEATQTGIMLVDQDRRLVTANDVAKDRFDELVTFDDDRVDAVAGVPVTELIDPVDGGRWHSTVLEVDSFLRHFVAVARPIEASRGVPRGWVIQFDDVTAERKQQREAEQQRQLATLGRFAAGIAHDVNNVLTAIGLNADLLQSSEDLGSPERTRVAQIIDQTKRADQFIRQVLDYCRRSVVAPKVIDLGQLVDHQLEGLNVLLSDQTELRVTVDPGVYIVADPANTQQVVLNLITNARDSLGGEGTIDVHVDRYLEVAPDASVPVGEWARLVVRDAGCGIPEDQLEAIFEPFMTTKEVGEGTGLGLAQVSGIVRQNNGYVVVDSTVGVGSTFTVYLPAVDPAVFEKDRPDPVAASTGPEPIGAAVPEPGRGQLVLVVDDDRAINDALVELLDTNGYRTIRAFDGAEVLKHWDEWGPSVDLVLTDLVMPNLSGTELVIELRERGATVPIIGVSAMITEAEIGETATGVYTWIRKPVDRDHLLAEAAAALRSTPTTEPSGG